eukprot:1158130-Pelagomonas_calceolata.AAC.2
MPQCHTLPPTLTHLHAVQLGQQTEDAGNHGVGGREDLAALAALQQLGNEGQHSDKAATLYPVHYRH